MIFYHRGEFFSRAGIDEGMLTWHPYGLHHGPQPGARAARRGGGRRPTGERRMADEVAVMIDARHALVPGEAAKDLDVEGYVRVLVARRVRLARYRSARRPVHVGRHRHGRAASRRSHAGDGRAGQDALLGAAMARPAVPAASRRARAAGSRPPPAPDPRAAVDPRLLRLRGPRGHGPQQPRARDGARLVRAARSSTSPTRPSCSGRTTRCEHRARPSELDYELEVAAVIGLEGADVPPDRVARRRRRFHGHERLVGPLTCSAARWR